MLPEIERRSLAAELRAVEDAASKKKKIVGYAAKYNSLSGDLGGFREIIMPGAFDRAIRDGHDVRALWNHNSDLVLGRTKSGTLRLSTDAEGLKIDNDMPDTQAARDALVSIERGDVDQMSFAFRTLSDNWRTEGGEAVRELLDVELLDISPVAYPAYEQTQVSARALDKAKETIMVKPSIREALDKGVFRHLSAEQRERSYEDKLNLIWAGLCTLLGPPWDQPSWWYVEATFDDHVIIERDYILWSYPMTFDVDRKPTFGTPTKVEAQYVPVVDPAAEARTEEHAALELARARQQLLERTL